MEGVEKTRALMDGCLGKEQAGRAIINGTVLNVYTGEWIKNQTVLIEGEWIAYVGADRPESSYPLSWNRALDGNILSSCGRSFASRPEGKAKRKFQSSR
jgi:adenine deaminase